MLHVTMDWAKLIGGQNMSPALLLKFILGLSSVIAHVRGQCRPPTCRIDNGQQVQCSSCPLGYGVQVENRQPLVCQSDPNPRDTQCIPCVTGVNYSNVVDSKGTCRTCLVCNDDTEEVERNCTITSNTECRCRLGFYYHSEVNACWECPNCTTTSEEEVCRNRQCPSATPLMTTRPTSPSTVTRTTEAVSGAGGSTTKLMVSRVTGQPTRNADYGNSQTKIIVGVVLCIVLLGSVIGVYMYKCKPWNRYSWLTWSRMCKAFSHSKDAKYNSVAMENGTARLPANGVANGNAGRSLHPESIAPPSPCGQPNGVANGHAGGAPDPDTTAPPSPCVQTNGVPNGHAVMAPPPEPTAPPQEVQLTGWEENYISSLLTVDEAIGLARLKLSIPDSKLEIWRDQGSAAHYLMERWRENGRSRDDFLDALPRVGRQDLADHVNSAGT